MTEGLCVRHGTFPTILPVQARVDVSKTNVPWAFANKCFVWCIVTTMCLLRLVPLKLKNVCKEQPLSRILIYNN